MNVSLYSFKYFMKIFTKIIYKYYEHVHMQILETLKLISNSYEIFFCIMNTKNYEHCA